LPSIGEPDSSAVREWNGQGQIRVYGRDGKAQTNYDFGHDHGYGDPHAHDWDWTQERPRGPGRELRSNE